MKSTRINTGIYEISVDGRLFQIEKTGHSDWQLTERFDNASKDDDYFNHFWTKADAMKAIEKELKGTK